MHDPHPTNVHAGQRIPFKQEGWGIAALVVLLALLCIAGATYVHKRTYLPPTDVRNQAAGSTTNADVPTTTHQ
jgi:hypothetical protein